MRTLSLVPLALLIVNAGLAAAQPAALPPAMTLKGQSYDADFFPGSHHDAAVPTPDSILGFRLGDRAARHAQVEAILKSVAQTAPARTKLFQYATSHEGRALYYIAISSPENISRLDQIKKDNTALADPRTQTEQTRTQIAENAPAIAWMAYVIHGDEMSGTDAALALTHHLASSTDADVAELLKDVVVLIDPLMNPDGRERCITGIDQTRARQPMVDDQSMPHAQPWPGGRMNHYLFDMNRDWIWGTQPESRGRIKAASEWNPHYFVESHEQTPLDTFLFMPPRAPINPNIPKPIAKWSRIFGDEQGKAFDAFGWRYYTGEWNEEWYPGYSGSWAALRGSIDNLYEQARIISDGVRRGEGTIEPYRSAVHKQLVASMANLKTLQAHRREVVKDFAEQRQLVTEGKDEASRRVFLIDPSTDNPGRRAAFIDMMELQGIEIYEATGPLKLAGTDWLGRPFKDQDFPIGTLIVPAAQPLGRLAAALLELDPRMDREFLIDERRELLRFNQSRLYDTTGWNAAMFFGLPICESAGTLPTAVRRVTSAGPTVPAAAASAPVAIALMGDDDRSPAIAARLMEAGMRVRALDKPTVLDSTHFPRGTFFITRVDNPELLDPLKTVTETAVTFGAAAVPVGGGMGEGDLPDLGGGHFVLLEQPRIAVVGRGPTAPYSFGEIWYLFDHEMGIRASYLDASEFADLDLRRYNVLVLPDGAASRAGDKIPAIKSWVESGGTLIAIGSSAVPFTKDKDGIGSVRLLPDVLGKLDAFHAAIVRDWLGKTTEVDPSLVWSHGPPAKLEYPWTLGETPKVEEDEAKRRDEWRSLFMPTGALLATRTDDRHWLTCGCGPVLPVIYTNGAVLIPPQSGLAPVLMGAIVPAPAPAAPATPPEKPRSAPAADLNAEGQKSEARPDAPTISKDDKKDDKKDEKKDERKEEPKPGWLLAPPGYELRLRMSGLLWPEAADRIAHSAYVTQEHIGRGQIILFADNPTFRGAARGSARLFMNAAILGPGMGASAPIRP